MKKVFADWKNPAEYPDGDKSTPLERWKWEFIRRNPTYQQLYRDFVNYERKQRAQIIKDYEKINALPEGEQKIEAENLWGKLNEDEKNYFRLIEQRLFLLFGIHADHVVIIDPATIPPHLDLYLKDSPYEDPPYIIGAGGEGIKMDLYYKPTHVVLLFDISFSIPEQAESARKLLNKQLDREKIKAEVKGLDDLVGRKSKPQPDKLQRYLRILDALSEKATRKEIKEVLFPKNFDPKSSVQDSIEKAKYYRDKGFRELC